MKMGRKVAVVTTFSKAGFEQYAERMIETWAKHWPQDVDLFVYPDEAVPLPNKVNVHNVARSLFPIKELEVFKNRARANRAHCGYPAEAYNYRFDAVKFCHKPFALWHFMHNVAEDHDALIWLDADTITHQTVTPAAVEQMAPPDFDIQYLGRCYKYTECGYIYFNLKSQMARQLLDDWVEFYIKRTFRHEAEWHDSYLFDVARKRLGDGLKGNDLTGHIPRRKGAGHPFVNSFLGKYMDHHKGDSRKRSNAPRKGDLFADHDSDYWRKHPHAKARTDPRT